MLPFTGTFPSEYGVVTSPGRKRDTATLVSSMETPWPREATVDTLLAPLGIEEAQACPDTAANASQAASASSISFVIVPSLSKSEMTVGA
jgi:hypothetical protein